MRCKRRSDDAAQRKRPDPWPHAAHGGACSACLREVTGGHRANPRSLPRAPLKQSRNRLRTGRPPCQVGLRKPRGGCNRYDLDAYSQIGRLGTGSPRRGVGGVRTSTSTNRRTCTHTHTYARAHAHTHTCLLYKFDAADELTPLGPGCAMGDKR